MADLILLAPRQPLRPAYRWTSKLEGRNYGFRMAYNTRMLRWFMDVADADGDIVEGLRVATGIDLFGGFNDSRLPPGQLFVLDESGTMQEPDMTAFHTGHRMVYRPAADVTALEGTAYQVW